MLRVAACLLALLGVAAAAGVDAAQVFCRSTASAVAAVTASAERWAVAHAGDTTG